MTVDVIPLFTSHSPLSGLFVSGRSFSLLRDFSFTRLSSFEMPCLKAYNHGDYSHNGYISSNESFGAGIENGGLILGEVDGGSPRVVRS